MNFFKKLSATLALDIKEFVLILIPIALYFNSLFYGFIWDDHTYILNNTVLDTIDGISKIWTTHVNVDFWPVSYSLLWLQKQLFGNDAFGYHVVNLFLFTLSVFLVYKLLKKVSLDSAYILALIFALHPMNVAAVAWVFQIKTNLANVLGLLSAIFIIKFFENKKIIYYLFSLIFVVLSFLSKISLVMLPVIFLLYLYFSDKLSKRNLLALMPFFILSFALGVANVLWDQNSLPVPESELILSKNIFFRFLLVGQNFLFYLRQTFFPIDLMFVHPKIDPNFTLFWDYIPSLSLAAVLLYVLIAMLRNQKDINVFLVGISFSFFFLLPALGVSEIYFMRFSYVAEHYLTLGMLGFLYPAICVLNKKVWGKIVIYIFLTALFYQSYNYISDYESEKKLLEINIVKNPDNILPHNILGLLYKNENNLDKALYHYDRSISIHPNAASYYNKASLFERLNQLDMARINYEKAIELNPYVVNSYINLAVVNIKLKNFTAALDYFFTALKVDPADVRIYYNIGYAYEENGDLINALDWYKKALQLAPNNVLFKEAVARINK